MNIDWLEKCWDPVLHESYEVGCYREGGVCQACIDSTDTPDLFCAGCGYVQYKHKRPDKWLGKDIAEAEI